MNMIVWLGLGALAIAALTLAAVKGMPRRVPARGAGKIMTKP